MSVVVLGLIGSVISIQGWFDTTNEEILTSQVQSTDTLKSIDAKLNELQRSNEFKEKYPLGYCIFYADGGSEIRRVGQTEGVEIAWDQTRIELTPDLVYLETEYSGRRKGASLGTGYYQNSFPRQKTEPVQIATILNSTELLFEIVEDRTSGVVGVFGLRKSPYASDEDMVILRIP